MGCMLSEGSSMQQPRATWQARQTEQAAYKRSLLAPSCLKQQPLQLHGGPDFSFMLQQLQLRLPLALSWCSTAPLLFRKATTSLCLWRTASMMGVPLYLRPGKQPINNHSCIKQRCLAAPAAWDMAGAAQQLAGVFLAEGRQAVLFVNATCAASSPGGAPPASWGSHRNSPQEGVTALGLLLQAVLLCSTPSMCPCHEQPAGNCH